MPNRRTACHTVLIVGLMTAAHTLPAWAQSDLGQVAGQWVEQSLGTQTAPSASAPALRAEVQVGRLDSRLQLAPCGRIEPYLPAGARLWGRTRIGLKCLEGTVAWNVFLPVTVKAWGPAWVIKKHTPAHTVLTADDAEWVAEVDWAESREPVVALPEQWVGMQTAFTLTAGQALRHNAVRPPLVFAIGSQVRVLASGVGFEMTATGQALTPGHFGRSARVKLSSGKIVAGPVNKEGAVELAL